MDQAPSAVPGIVGARPAWALTANRTISPPSVTYQDCQEQQALNSIATQTQEGDTHELEMKFRSLAENSPD